MIMVKVNNKALELSRQASEKKRSSANAAGILVGTTSGPSFVDDNPLVPIRRIKLEQIKQREKNEFELVNITQLAESIMQCGLIDPISVIHEVGTGDEYVIVSGHRRYEAYKVLNSTYPNDERYQTIPASVYELTTELEAETNGLPYISKEQEEEMYREANMQARQLTYGEVAKQVRKIVFKLDDEEYYNKLNMLSNDSDRYSITKGNRPKMIMNVLSAYSYQGWQRETIRRYLKIYEAVKYNEIPPSILDDIENGTTTVKKAYERYIAKATNSFVSQNKKSINTIKKNLVEIETQSTFLTTEEKKELEQCIEKLKSILYS